MHLTIDLADPADVACAASYAAYLVVSGELRDLSAGASVDAAGRLNWQPGPAFRGHYNFAAIRTDCNGQKSRIAIVVNVG